MSSSNKHRNLIIIQYLYSISQINTWIVLINEHVILLPTDHFTQPTSILISSHQGSVFYWHGMSSGLNQCIRTFWLSPIQMRYECAHSAKLGFKLAWIGVNLLHQYIQMIFNPVVNTPKNATGCKHLKESRLHSRSYWYSHIVVCVFMIWIYLKTKNAMGFLNKARRRNRRFYQSAAVVLFFVFSNQWFSSISYQAPADNWKILWMVKWKKGIVPWNPCASETSQRKSKIAKPKQTHK